MYFSFNSHMGKLRNLTKGQGKPQIKIKPRLWVLGAWEHLWPKVMLEIPVTALLTALGLLSRSSLTDQGRLAEPFGFVMGLAVQHCLLFWDFRNRYLNIGKNSFRQKCKSVTFFSFWIWDALRINVNYWNCLTCSGADFFKNKNLLST